MSSAVFNGFALAYQIGTGSTVGVEGYAQVFLDSLPIVHRAKVDEHVGVDGNIGAIVHTGEYVELSITFRPASSTSKSAADAQLMFLAKGSTVTLSGFKVVKLGAIVDLLNQDWLLVGDVTLTMSSQEPASVDMTIRHYLEKQSAILSIIS